MTLVGMIPADFKAWQYSYQVAFAVAAFSGVTYQADYRERPDDGAVSVW
ncbi:hypothetical protein FACS1894137_20010 [Spirochaetia bacterium]|nr:hypothetical protein FACS1894137_20010 [Spirochaetia bacterium]